MLSFQNDEPSVVFSRITFIYLFFFISFVDVCIHVLIWFDSNFPILFFEQKNKFSFLLNAPVHLEEEKYFLSMIINERSNKKNEKKNRHRNRNRTKNRQRNLRLILRLFDFNQKMFGKHVFTYGLLIYAVTIAVSELFFLAHSVFELWFFSFQCDPVNRLKAYL